MRYLKVAFAVSGMLLAVLWPFLTIGTFHLGSNPPAGGEYWIHSAWITFFAWPVVWFLCLWIAIAELRNRRRRNVLKFVSYIPFIPLAAYIAEITVVLTFF